MGALVHGLPEAGVFLVPAEHVALFVREEF